jgi:hypothetical protein
MLAQSPLSYRLDVAHRALLAIFGGFAVASLTGIAIALILIRLGLMTPAAAVSLMTLLSWLTWACVAMWAFHAGRSWQLWVTILGICAASRTLALTLGPL